jgi:hypothetical protein
LKSDWKRSSNLVLSRSAEEGLMGASVDGMAGY